MLKSLKHVKSKKGTEVCGEINEEFYYKELRRTDSFSLI